MSMTFSFPDSIEDQRDETKHQLLMLRDDWWWAVAVEALLDRAEHNPQYYTDMVNQCNEPDMAMVCVGVLARKVLGQD